MTRRDAEAAAIDMLAASCREMLREQERRLNIMAARPDFPAGHGALEWLRGFVTRGRAALAAAEAAGLILPPADPK